LLRCLVCVWEQLQFVSSLLLVAVICGCDLLPLLFSDASLCVSALVRSLCLLRVLCLFVWARGCRKQHNVRTSQTAKTRPVGRPLRRQRQRRDAWKRISRPNLRTRCKTHGAMACRVSLGLIVAGAVQFLTCPSRCPQTDTVVRRHGTSKQQARWRRHVLPD